MEISHRVGKTEMRAAFRCGAAVTESGRYQEGLCAGFCSSCQVVFLVCAMPGRHKADAAANPADAAINLRLWMIRISSRHNRNGCFVPSQLCCKTILLVRAGKIDSRSGVSAQRYLFYSFSTVTFATQSARRKHWKTMAYFAALAALSINAASWRACERKIAWLPGSSMTCDWARFAMNRSRSGLIIRSCLEITA